MPDMSIRSIPPCSEDISSPETASERLQDLLEVFRLLIQLRRQAHDHHSDMKAEAAYLHSLLVRDPNKPDILNDIDESAKLLPFVLNATTVFAVTILDDLLESMQRVLENGDTEQATKTKAIIRGGCPQGSADKPGKFTRHYVFVSLYLALMDEQEALDALRQPPDKPILDQRFAVLELYRKRCIFAHDDPFVDMRAANQVKDYVNVYNFVQRLDKKWNESCACHEPTPHAT
jgi:hypothetical protein